MGTLSFTAVMSIDGYLADAHGSFDWAAPNDEVFAVHSEHASQISLEVMGRRTYQLMTYWDRPPSGEGWSPQEEEFARQWQETQALVVSSTLTREDVRSARTQLIHSLTVDQLKRIVTESPGEVAISGPTTAAAAIRAGMVNDLRLFVVPHLVGGGLAALPPGAWGRMTLARECTFSGGTVLLHYTRG